jgi:seryl-tRNA synthetase
MLDLRSIREDPERARAALARRGAADALDELLRLDERRRELLPQVEERRARQNRASDEIAEAKRAGGDAEPLIAEMREVSAELKRLESELADVEAARDELAATLPNLPDPEAPEGETEEDAVSLREIGERPSFDFEPRDHLELGLANGWIEMEKAGEASGSRFAYLLGDLAMLELALVRFAVELLRGEGFTPTIPPVLVREGPLFGTGFFPGEREMIYEVPRDELFLVGTSEVSLAALHAGEILASDDLPIRYAGFSTCFRRESGAGGKDTRGIFRVHQFDKVEMFSFVRPDESRAEHERLLELEERILQALEIPYRVVDIPTGDLGASAARKFDCEAWFPSQDRYREVTSCSNTTDYQARRLDCRFRPEPDASPVHVHTLNGTAVAGRALIALIENQQRADGSVGIPAALREAGAPASIPTGSDG